MIKDENLILEKSYAFALHVIEVVRQIRKKNEYELASQLWRSGTSIGANVEEAQAAQSRADFKSKMSIAAKEAREVYYWLRLTRDAKVLHADTINPILQEADSIRRILISIVKSTN